MGNELAQLLTDAPLDEYLQDLKTVLVQGMQIEVQQQPSEQPPSATELPPASHP